MLRFVSHLFIITVLLLFTGCNNKVMSENEQPGEQLGITHVGTPAQSFSEFENILERIRTDLKIPGFSAAISKNGKIVWAKGFGFADKENGKVATPETVYHLASLTKPFAATLIMQLVEEKKLNLEDPIINYGVDLGNKNIKIKHLLSHTSENTPGTSYNYNGNRYSSLDIIVKAVTNKSFCELLNERIIMPLGLNSTGPYPLSQNNCLKHDSQNQQISRKLAQGYTPNGQHRMAYPKYFGTAAGLVSNVIDLCKFSIALDDNILISDKSKKIMFTPTISNNGEELPYGLGWFIDNNDGLKIVWHYGKWDAISSLIVKIPERGISFVILANSDRLSSASGGIGFTEDVNCSVVAQEFLNAFVFGKVQLPDLQVLK